MCDKVRELVAASGNREPGSFSHLKQTSSRSLLKRSRIASYLANCWAIRRECVLPNRVSTPNPWSLMYRNDFPTLQMTPSFWWTSGEKNRATNKIMRDWIQVFNSEKEKRMWFVKFGNFLKQQGTDSKREWSATVLWNKCLPRLLSEIICSHLLALMIDDESEKERFVGIATRKGQWGRTVSNPSSPPVLLKTLNFHDSNRSPYLLSPYTRFYWCTFAPMLTVPYRLILFHIDWQLDVRTYVQQFFGLGRNQPFQFPIGWKMNYAIQNL